MNRLIINSPHTSARVKCQIYSRVVGYYRPVKQWNDSKAEEFKDRVEFKTEVSA